MADVLEDVMGSLWVKVTVQTDGTLPAHVDAANEQHARDTKRAQALDLAEAQGEAVRRRLDAPGDSSQSQNVRGQVSNAVPGIGHHGLGVEGPAANELGNGHGQVGQQADAGYADARVVLVGRREVGIIVVMVMMAVATVVACLAHGWGEAEEFALES